MKTLVIYHKVDWDGWTSAAVALSKIPNAQLLGWNYDDELPNVDEFDQVILLDVTLSSGKDYTWMYDNQDKLIWIDHHGAAINLPGLENVDGLRRNGIGACILAWEYFFPGKQIPPHVALCGVYDAFCKDGSYADWEDAWVYSLAIGKYSEGKGRLSPEQLVQLAIQFINESPEEIQQRIQEGMGMEEDRMRKEEELFHTANLGTVNGLRICTLIADGRPAALIKTNIDNHTADIFFLRATRPVPGTNLYKVSIRVPEKSNVNAHEIARKYNEGGGHLKAAGCKMTEEEFNNLTRVGIKESIIRKQFNILWY